MSKCFYFKMGTVTCVIFWNPENVFFSVCPMYRFVSVLVETYWDGCELGTFEEMKL